MTSLSLLVMPLLMQPSILLAFFAAANQEANQGQPQDPEQHLQSCKCAKERGEYPASPLDWSFLCSQREEEAEYLSSWRARKKEAMDLFCHQDVSETSRAVKCFTTNGSREHVCFLAGESSHGGETGEISSSAVPCGNSGKQLQHLIH